MLRAEALAARLGAALDAFARCYGPIQAVVVLEALALLVESSDALAEAAYQSRGPWAAFARAAGWSEEEDGLRDGHDRDRDRPAAGVGVRGSDPRLGNDANAG